MRRILLPLEQTDRSLKALQYFRGHYKPKEVGVVLLMVDESLPYTATAEDETEALVKIEQKLNLIKVFLEGYDVVSKAAVGKAGPRIVKLAREYGVSFIAMTKSSKPDMLNQIGKTTEYVLLNAPCNVLIVSENNDSNEYRGLVYTKAQSMVNLRGQIGNKQSECLLPSAAADCNYQFSVSVGKVRFFHTVYNPETRNWDMPPSDNQKACVDISAGETVNILVKAGSVDGKPDRIRIVNRGIKDEAVFEYKIVPYTSDTVEGIDDSSATDEASVNTIASLGDANSNLNGETAQPIIGAEETPANINSTEAAAMNNLGVADVKSTQGDERASFAAMPEMNIPELVLPAMNIPTLDLGIVYERPEWDEEAYISDMWDTSIDNFDLMEEFQADVGYLPDLVIPSDEDVR